MSNEELVSRYQDTGDQDILLQLFQLNSGMITKIVSKYSGYEDPEDLRQEAFFGLRQAALLWRPEGGASFIHYATYWLKQTIQRYIDCCGTVVRVPVHQQIRIRKYTKVVHDFQMLFGRKPSDRELQEALDLSPEQLEDVKRDVFAIRIRSTSEPLGEEGDATLEDTIPAEGDAVEDLLDQIQEEELRQVLWSCVDALGDRESQVLHDRYENGHSLRECADTMGVSMECIRQLEAKALRKLRRPKVARQLLSFTDQFAYERGLKHSSLALFRIDHTSSQERAIMILEKAQATLNEARDFTLGFDEPEPD